MKSRRLDGLLVSALVMLPGVALAAMLCGCSEHADVASLCKQAQVYAQRYQTKAAADLLQTALRQIGYGSDVEKDRARLLVCLGNIEVQQRNDSEAESDFQEACDIYRRCLGVDCVELAEPLSGLEKVLEQRKQFAEAETTARQCLGILDRHVKADDPRLEPAINAVLGVACRSGRCKDEIDLYKRLVVLRTEIFGKNSPLTAAARFLLAEAYIHHHDWQPAIDLCRTNVEAARASQSPGLATALDNLAHVLDEAGQPASALPVIEESLALRRRHMAEVFPQQMVATLHAKSRILIDLGRYGDAEKNSLALIEEASKVYGPDSVKLADYYVEMAEILSKQGKQQEARRYQSQAERLYKST